MNTRFLELFKIAAAVTLLYLSVTGVMAADKAKEIDWAAFNPDIKGATFVKSSTECLECHEDYMRTYALTKMGRSLPSGGCESCHGPMSKHLDAPRQKPALVVSQKNLTPEQGNAICTACHQSGIQLNWQISSHAAAGNTCTNCHDIMSMEDPVLTRTTQVKVCFACHKDKRAQMNRRSRHPIKEGKVVCSDCHNPHGSAGPSQLVKHSVTETCYQCHAEKRGPFVVEHQPAREDCTICHNPHGSVVTRMLKVKEPWLCQQCHSEGYHPSTLYSATGTPGQAGAAQQLLGRSCTNCHVQVHGSNHPSGQRLTR
jgi:DmsE family decaheme c-type cytochrome